MLHDSNIQRIMYCCSSETDRNHFFEKFQINQSINDMIVLIYFNMGYFSRIKFHKYLDDLND